MKIYLRALLITSIFAIAILTVFIVWKQKVDSSDGIVKLKNIEALENQGVQNLVLKDIRGNKFSIDSLKSL